MFTALFGHIPGIAQLPAWRSWRGRVPTTFPLLPDGQILGRWTPKWPSKITCDLGNQRPRKRHNSRFFRWFGGGGVAGLRPNFFSSGLSFLARLAQESWWDLAAVHSSSPVVQLSAPQQHIYVASPVETSSSKVHKKFQLQPTIINWH